MNLLRLCVLLAVVASEIGPAALAQLPSTSPPALEPLYPFVKGGKWGYINAQGTWQIDPRFDLATAIFKKEYVRVWRDKRWGYIDRAGNWHVEPQFTSPCFDPTDAGLEVVSIARRQGILDRSGKLLLPVEYDEIVLFDDRAFVRRGQKLGILGLDGAWIQPLSIPWPKGRDMPVSTANRAAWFKQGPRWGLISQNGEILFPPQFEDHALAPRESEEWDHPEGINFERGRAWVISAGAYWLITDAGKVLTKRRIKGVEKWSNDAYLFRTGSTKVGLISRDGEVLAPPEFDDIGELRDGLALVHKTFARDNGKSPRTKITECAFIDQRGKVVVPFGKYSGAKPFSEGLAVVWKPLADRVEVNGVGFIDSAGSEVIPLTFHTAESFHQGLAQISVVLPGKAQDVSNYHRFGFINKAGEQVIVPRYWRAEKPADGMIPVSTAIPGSPASYYYHFLWGYVDFNGRETIPQRFGWTTPFYRNRAWVLEAGADPAKPLWALIDQSGRVLTEHAYYPPERFDNLDKQADLRLEESRWRGDLIVLAAGDFQKGLATAEGKVLVEPIFHRIGTFNDGVAVATEYRDSEFMPCLLLEDGQVLVRGEYTQISDFKSGISWVAKRNDSGKNRRFVRWGLIDRSGKLLLQPIYMTPSWLPPSTDYRLPSAPQFIGDLAAVALADEYDPSRENPAHHNPWGYVNREGRIIAWTEK